VPTGWAFIGSIPAAARRRSVRHMTAMARMPMISGTKRAPSMGARRILGQIHDAVRSLHAALGGEALGVRRLVRGLGWLIVRVKASVRRELAWRHAACLVELGGLTGASRTRVRGGAQVRRGGQGAEYAELLDFSGGRVAFSGWCFMV
jgi:hypothetical protein